MAYAIGRRAGTAVERNRLRRRLRAIMAGAAPDLPGGAYLIRAAPDAAGLGSDRLRAVLAGALDRATSHAGGTSRSSSGGPAEVVGGTR